MTKIEQTISNLKKLKSFHNGSYGADIDRAIKSLEQDPCEDAISRKSIKQKLQEHHDFFVNAYGGFSNLPQKDKARVDEITNCIAMVVNEPSVTPKPKTGHCKDCKYFEYDVVAGVDGIPLIVAHELCSKWGDGCKTREDGYCFLFEQKESEEEEERSEE